MHDTAITRADFMKDRIVIARTRIEHLFARLDAWGFISNCRLSYETTTYAFDLIMVITHLREMASPPSYEAYPIDPEPIDGVRSAVGEVCTCSLEKEKELLHKAKMHRLNLIDHWVQWEVEGVAGKKEKKRARDLDDLGPEC